MINWEILFLQSNNLKSSNLCKQCKNKIKCYKAAIKRKGTKDGLINRKAIIVGKMKSRFLLSNQNKLNR